MWWYFALIVSVVFGVFTILAEIYLRTRPMYKVACEMSNGPKLRWFWDDLQFTLSLNLENTFTHLRRFARTFKQSYRYYSFGLFHVHIIRAEDAEVNGLLDWSQIINHNCHLDLCRQSSPPLGTRTRASSTTSLNRSWDKDFWSAADRNGFNGAKSSPPHFTSTFCNSFRKCSSWVGLD